LDSIKLKIPAFQGEKNDLKAYLDWENKMEFAFDFHRYLKEKKVKLVIVEFINYAIICWDQLVLTQWEEIKAIMRKSFVPNHYYREIYNIFQSLSHGSKSVDKYFKEMKITMIRANIF
jgi:hypothetical protein